MAAIQTLHAHGCSTTRHKFILAAVAFLIGVSIYTSTFGHVTTGLLTVRYSESSVPTHRVASGVEHGDNAQPPSLRSPTLGPNAGAAPAVRVGVGNRPTE